MSGAPRFRVGLSRDILTRVGKPSFGTGPLALLADATRIEWEFLPESVDEITPDIMARYDGLYVNAPRVTAASVARTDLRVRIVARHGVGYDSVDVPALAAKGVIATNTPVAVRRPVAVAALTFIFALAGRLVQKDRLTRTGRWHDRTSHMGLGLTTRTLGVIGAGGIGRNCSRSPGRSAGRCWPPTPTPTRPRWRPWAPNRCCSSACLKRRISSSRPCCSMTQRGI